MKHFFNKYKKTLFIPVIGCISILLYFFIKPEQATESSLFEQVTIPEQSTGTNLEQQNIEQNNSLNEHIIVDIKGAVLRPGVYTFSTQERVADAIAKAGGYTEDANENYLNLAQKLKDEMVIYVPKIDEELVSSEMVQAPNTWNNEKEDGKVNLNEATESDLTTLPGIGPAKARAILEYREQQGSFKSIDELKNVSGIGDKTFEKLKEYVDI